MRRLRATALLLVATLLPVACGDSEESTTLNVNTLTEAGAILALSIGEVVERYAAGLTEGDATQDQQRLRTIVSETFGSLATGNITESFIAAAEDSRQKGNSKAETAKQLLSAAMVAWAAFDQVRPDYTPGDQAMRDEIASYFAQNMGSRLSASYGLHSGGWEASDPDELSTALAEATGLTLFVACYNYARPDGSRPIRDRMRRLDMPLAPAAWVDHTGNLGLPIGDESVDEIESFEEWRVPSEGTNPLWSAVLGFDREGLAEVFRPAAETAFE